MPPSQLMLPPTDDNADISNIVLSKYNGMLGQLNYTILGSGTNLEGT
jgi:hypothetical protein